MAQNSRVDDYTTCAACEGSGKNNDGTNCFECSGTGKKQQSCTIPEGPEHEGVCDWAEKAVFRIIMYPRPAFRLAGWVNQAADILPMAGWMPAASFLGTLLRFWQMPSGRTKKPSRLFTARAWFLWSQLRDLNSWPADYESSGWIFTKFHQISWRWKYGHL